jgi:ribosomal protein S12
MPTIEQLKRKPRIKKRSYSKAPGLEKNPQKKKEFVLKFIQKLQKNLTQQ